MDSGDLRRFRIQEYGRFCRFCQEFWGIDAATASRSYTERQLKFYFALWGQKELEQQDRIQWAVTRGVITAIWGKAQGFDSALFGRMFPGSEEEKHFSSSTGRPFPEDVVFLSSQDLAQIKQIPHERLKDGVEPYHAWPPARIFAYEGKDRCAKRAAVSAFLWDRYDEDPTMTISKLKLWYEVEIIEKILSSPSWFRNQHFSKDYTSLWEERLKPHRETLEARHRDLLEKIMQL